jgi:hypothetical protein
VCSSHILQCRCWFCPSCGLTARCLRLAPVEGLGSRGWTGGWCALVCRRGRCPTGPHKASSPGSIPGPAFEGKLWVLELAAVG